MAVDHDVDHGDAAARGADLCRLLFAQVLRHESQPAAHHVAVHENLFHHTAHQIDGNCKADTLRSAIGSIEHSRIDADQIAMRIDECAAGVAEIDGRIGLNKIFKRRQAQLTAAGCADDTLSHGLAHAIGVADGEHDIADPQGIGSTQRHDGQVADLEIEDGQIRVRVLPDDRGVGDTSIRKLHPDRIGAGDHMLIRYNGAHGIDDHARS